MVLPVVFRVSRIISLKLQSLFRRIISQISISDLNINPVSYTHLFCQRSSWARIKLFIQYLFSPFKVLLTGTFYLKVLIYHIFYGICFFYLFVYCTWYIFVSTRGIISKTKKIVNYFFYFFGFFLHLIVQYNNFSKKHIFF